MYYKAVVNAGESYLFKDDHWLDWSIASKRIAADQSGSGDTIVVDNFSIKIFGTDETIWPVVTTRDKTVSVEGKVDDKTGNLAENSSAASITKGCDTTGANTRTRRALSLTRSLSL